MIDRLPYGWEIVQIGQVADFINGYSQFNSKSYVDNGIPIFRIGDLGGQVDLSGVKRVSKDVVPNLNQKRLFRGDILIAKIGKRVGASSVYNFDEPAILSSQVAGVRAKRIEQKFLACFIESPFFYDAIKPHFFGSTRDNISPNQIRLTSIPFPPLPTQRKIAAVLSPYDDLIENNTRRIKILEEMAGTIYRQWFVEFRFPGHEKVPMVESELGLIPQGWEVGKLGDLAESVRRNIKPSDMNQETPYFGLEHLPRKSIALSNWDSVDSINSTKLAFKKGEILFGKIRPYFHKVGVAPLDGICSSDTIVIRPKRNECFAITLSYVSSEHFIEYATTTSQGTKMPRADWKVLVKYPVVIPPDQITQRFSGFLRDVIDKIQNLIFRNRNLRQTRDLLLPKLISGKIDVSDLDIDINL